MLPVKAEVGMWHVPTDPVWELWTNIRFCFWVGSSQMNKQMKICICFTLLGWHVTTLSECHHLNRTSVNLKAPYFCHVWRHMSSKNWRVLNSWMWAEKKEGIFFFNERLNRRHAYIQIFLACVIKGKCGRKALQTFWLCACQGNKVKYLRDYFLAVTDTCRDSWL